MLQSALLNLAFLLASPGPCPTEVGQMRWDGFEHRFSDGSRRWAVTISLWDRDTNARPSDGDAVRLTRVLADGSDAGIDDAWFLLGPGLARDLAVPFKKAAPSLPATCESRFDVKGLPRLGSRAELGRFLAGLSGGPSRGPSPADRLRGDMGTWADEICRVRRDLDRDSLEKHLVAKALQGGTSLPRNEVRGLAREVSEQKALSCARLEGNGYTF